MKPLHIFVGFDSRERAAYEVAVKTIELRSPTPVYVRSLKLAKLAKSELLTRPVECRDGRLWCPISEAPMATEFAISRFCVPLIQKKGWALFVDCDVVCLSDIAELFAQADDRYAVMVVKHNQESGPATKMDGQVQTYYSRKNWSSVVLFNCGHPSNQKLTKEVLNTWPGRDLHAFKWLADEEIGTLDQKWNWLVNVTPGEPKREGIWHYTLGGPWLPGWEPKPFDDVWVEQSKL